MRRPLNPWPSFTDLMTVLAAMALFLAYAGEAARRDLAVVTAQRDQDRAALERLREEAAKNELMFRAIQEAQGVLDRLAGHVRGLDVGPDQTARFGDDLIHFEVNSTVVDWSRGRPVVLRAFCEALRDELARPLLADFRLSEAVLVSVEGHTDQQEWFGQPLYNWELSAGRAASVIDQMRDPARCPGGDQWRLEPRAFADTVKLTESTDAASLLLNRRVEIRIVPNYARIIELVRGQQTSPGTK